MLLFYATLLFISIYLIVYFICFIVYLNLYVLGALGTVARNLVGGTGPHKFHSLNPP